MKFDFINDKEIREILQRDYEELIKCYEIQANKSVLILSGSIIESILTEYFIDSPPTNKTRNVILKMSLGNLLDLALNDGIISKKIMALSSIIQDYRNLVHIGREIRQQENISYNDAELAMSLLKMIINSIKQKYSEKVKYNATDVFEKLKHDWSFHSVYDIIITKLNYSERENLLKLFVEFEQDVFLQYEYFQIFDDERVVDNKEIIEIERTKPFVKELKPLVKQDVILKYLYQLLSSITDDEKVVTLTLYNLFHEDIYLLKDDEQELIAIYMLGFLESITEDSAKLAAEKTFSTIGKYIKTKNGTNKLKEFTSFAITNYYWKEIKPEMDVFEQIFNSLSQSDKRIVLNAIDNYLKPIKGVLPKDILEGFVKDAVLRGIIEDKYS